MKKIKGDKYLKMDGVYICLLLCMSYKICELHILTGPDSVAAATYHFYCEFAIYACSANIVRSMDLLTRTPFCRDMISRDYLRIGSRRGIPIRDAP
jgi:hypothetical protein